MAEGLLRHLAGERYDVFSAGTAPSGLARHTVEVMREVGIDVSGQRSQHVDEFADQSFDNVIIVCSVAKDSCPPFAYEGERLFWDVEDPSDAVARGLGLIDAMRATRDDLRDRIEAFIAQP
jgi:arsenate reductase